MVSLESQTVFFQSIMDSALGPLLSEINLEESGEFVGDLSNATNLALNLIIAVKTDNREKAEHYYAIFQKRHPTRDSHWIYDDYVLFAIVSAVSKFRFESSWISDVINLSISGANAVDKMVRETFKNLLAGNYNARNDFHQISVVYQFLSKDEHYNDEHINKMYNDLWIRSFPFYAEDFLNVISLKAIQIAFVKKSFLSERNHYLLYQFIPLFNLRIQKLANTISFFTVICIIAGTFVGLWKLDQLEDQYPIYIKALFWAIGLSGVGVLGIAGWKMQIVSVTKKMLNKFFGFRED